MRLRLASTAIGRRLAQERAQSGAIEAGRKIANEVGDAYTEARALLSSRVGHLGDFSRRSARGLPP